MAHHDLYLASFNRMVLPTISKVQRLVSACLEPKLKPHDLTLAEFRIVGLLMGEAKGLSQKQLAQKLEITAASLSVAIANLEIKNWVERITDENDLRVKRIKVSTKADFSSVASVIASLEGDATQGIRQQDIAITQQVLEKILSNINNMNK